MNRLTASHLALLAWSAALCGCLQGEDVRDPSASVDRLHRCIGEAGYDEAALRSVVEDIAKDPQSYCNREEAGPERVHATHQATGGRARIRTAVLDGNCRLVKETHTEADIPSGQAYATVALWDGRDAQGRPMPSGGYYVNTEVLAADGSVDTAYQKIGYVRLPPCP